MGLSLKDHAIDSPLLNLSMRNKNKQNAAIKEFQALSPLKSENNATIFEAFGSKNNSSKSSSRYSEIKGAKYIEKPSKFALRNSQDKPELRTHNPADLEIVENLSKSSTNS